MIWRPYDNPGRDRTITDENAAASTDLIALTSGIVADYVGGNTVPASVLPRLIADTHTAIANLVTGVKASLPEEKPIPAVPIRKSVTPDFLICLEDGKRFKSLKRHLAASYDLTPDQYRQQWKLPADDPMVASNYSAVRSGLAKATGLGRKAVVAEAIAPPPGKRKKVN